MKRMTLEAKRKKREGQIEEKDSKFLFRCGQEVFDCSGAKITSLGEVDPSDEVFEEHGATTSKSILGEYGGDFPMKKIGEIDEMNLFEIEFDGFTSFKSLGINHTKKDEEVEND